MDNLTPEQRQAIDAPGHVMLRGPAGTGKTTALQRRLLRLLEEGVSAYNILTLVSELEHEAPYLALVQTGNIGPYANLNITTYNSLAREMVILFWPLVARDAGFKTPYRPPTFLEYDMAQLLMWRILEPLQLAGAFANLRLRPQRIVSQLIDILNRAAFNGLTLDEAVARQARIFSQEPDRLRDLQDAAEAARQFRRFCLDNSLLDFSLTIQVFDTYLVRHPEFHRYFQERYRHVLVDNLEEHTAAAQRFVEALMQTESIVALTYDTGGGYRRFLSADPLGGQRLAQYGQVIDFDQVPFTSTPAMRQLGMLVEQFLMVERGGETNEAHQAIWGEINERYRRQALGEIPGALLELIEGEGVAPSDIALVAPYLDGALEYTLQQELSGHGIPYRLLRRRSSPRDQPQIRAWLTWLALGHPGWGMPPAPFDVAEALALSIAGLDPVRAHLLMEYLYDAKAGILRPVDGLDAHVMDRVGHDNVELAETIRAWLEANGGTLPLDNFLYQLFNELLAQPPFQPDPEQALASAAVCDWLVDTASNLRRSAANIGLQDAAEIGRAFVDGIYQGLVTANPPDLGDPPDPDGVVIATLYGYLLSGLHSKVQVWLDAGSMGWWQTPYQPLSNAFVMVPSWDAETGWSAQEEVETRNQLLSHVVRGLTNRCTGGVLLVFSQLDRSGQRQNGPLWRALAPARLRRKQAAASSE